jgi:phosphomevalonate kinase
MSMETIRTSAPGKLFLLGEYAVLDGAPALLTAVDRRVDVAIEESDSGSWRLSAPNLGIENLALDPDGRLPAGLDPLLHAQLRLFDEVREAVLSRAPQKPRPLAISIDSSAFSRGGHKLGLGSSAAVATALSAALAAAAGLELDRAELFRLAHTAHRRAQNGTGSGGDVAASVYGGLIRYTQGADPVPLRWPDGLSIMAVVTGEGSLTTRLVGRVAEYAAEDPESYRADIDRLSNLAARAEDALGDPSSFLRLATDYFTALALLDAHARAGIVSERHHELHALAKREGGAFKTSGAGGGDVGLAFSYSGEPTERLAGALAEAGAVVVPLGFFAPGIQEGSES